MNLQKNKYKKLKENQSIIKSIKEALNEALSSHASKFVIKNTVIFNNDDYLNFFNLRSVYKKTLSEFVLNLIIGDCKDEKSLNFFQQNVYCIESSAYDAEIFQLLISVTSNVAISCGIYGISMPIVLLDIAYDSSDILKDMQFAQNQEYIQDMHKHKNIIFELIAYLFQNNFAINFIKILKVLIDGDALDKYRNDLKSSEFFSHYFFENNNFDAQDTEPSDKNDNSDVQDLEEFLKIDLVGREDINSYF